MHGGIATGVAQALYEEFVFDEDGNPLPTRSSATPSPRRDAPLGDGPDGDAEPTNPLGAKGIGESGTIGTTPAVLNAVSTRSPPTA